MKSPFSDDAGEDNRPIDDQTEEEKKGSQTGLGRITTFLSDVLWVIIAVGAFILWKHILGPTGYTAWVISGVLAFGLSIYFLKRKRK